MGSLAQKVRQKYPGVYDDLSDSELESKVLAKYPEYADLASAQPATTRPGEPPSPKHPYSIFARKAVDWLPAVGGAVGGMVGAAGGPAGAIGGAAFGGTAGEAARQNARRAMGMAAPDSGTAAVKDLAVSGAIQGAAEGAGQGLGVAMKAAAPWLMQSAVKPTLSLLKQFRTTAPKVVQTLLDEGVNVSQRGLQKIQNVLGQTDDAISEAVANAPGAISKKNVAAYVAPTAQRIGRQANPGADLKAVGESVDEFMQHPVYSGDTLTVAEAQAMKRATYQQVGKKYGQVSSASIETQKALARGLKEEIAAEVPQIAKLNARDAELMAAADAVGRRVALSGNKDPVGFAWVASHPATFIAALMDRHPVVKSMLANGLYKMAGTATGVSPQMIRTALVALATDDETPPGSDERTSNRQ